MNSPNVNLVDRRHPDSVDIELSIDINAPAEVVFDFLVDPELAFRWMGIEGDIDPQPGGAYRVRYSEESVAVGQYVDVARPSIVSWTWGWEGSDEIPPGSSLVTFALSEHDGVTTVTVTHTGLPDVSAAQSHTHGWSYWGSRLAVATAGGDPDEVQWPDETAETETGS